MRRVGRTKGVAVAFGIRLFKACSIMSTREPTNTKSTKGAKKLKLTVIDAAASISKRHST
jgi:hypothetical protein